MHWLFKRVKFLRVFMSYPQVRKVSDTTASAWLRSVVKYSLPGAYVYTDPAVPVFSSQSIPVGSPVSSPARYQSRRHPAFEAREVRGR